MLSIQNIQQPIKPSEVAGQKLQQIPDKVIEAFNEMIAQHYASGEALFKLKDVVALIARKGLKRSEIFDNNWLDVEPMYELPTDVEKLRGAFDLVMMVQTENHDYYIQEQLADFFLKPKGVVLSNYRGMSPELIATGKWKPTARALFYEKQF